jgi:hypothetical protein
VHAEPTHWLHEISISKTCLSPSLAWANTPIINMREYLFIYLFIYWVCMSFKKTWQNNSLLHKTSAPKWNFLLLFHVGLLRKIPPSYLLTKLKVIGK